MYPSGGAGTQYSEDRDGRASILHLVSNYLCLITYSNDVHSTNVLVVEDMNDVLILYQKY